MGNNGSRRSKAGLNREELEAGLAPSGWSWQPRGQYKSGSCNNAQSDVFTGSKERME